MEILNHFLLAFRVAAQPINLFYCFIGCLTGTFIGVLPGLGASAAIALLLPITYRIEATQAIIMLAGIYYGSCYGGSITSILINIPGESTTVVTCLDGYQMTLKGRAGPALGISAFGSFIGGTFALIMTMVLAPPLGRLALEFGPPENTAIMFFGLTMIVYLSQGPILKSLITGTFGLLLSFIGTDLLTGAPRYTLGIQEFLDGIDIIAIIMGLFGVNEVFLNIEVFAHERDVFKSKIKELLPTRQDWRKSGWPIARGTIGGFFLGLLPGGGPVMASFVSYSMEKKLSNHPESFGKGEIAGVAGPETANNAAAGGAFIPLMILGIPCTVVMGLLLGGFMIKGILPGPLLLEKSPELFWGVIGSMYIGNIILLVLNLPLIPIWVKILKIPYPILFPLILVFCLIGAYLINNSIVDVYVTISFGVIGYLLKKFDYPSPPLILAFLLGPRFEKSLGQSLMLSDGNPFIFFSRPISFVLFFLAFSLLFSPLLKRIIQVARRKSSKTQ